MLPAERLLILSPHVTVIDAFARQGIATTTEAPAPGQATAALVCLPRSRDEARDAIALAASLTDGPVIVDGQKDDGIDAMFRALRPLVALGDPIAKGHGKIAWFPSPGAAPLAAWRAVPGTVTDSAGRAFRTQAGVFSSGGVDPGSALLASVLPTSLGGVGADLGAGWGYLSASLLARAPGIDTLHLVEADARALECARSNIADPRARFHWRDATEPLPGVALDFVVMNPPFHAGRADRPDLGTAFIRAAAAGLKPGGRLWLVANRHLPYEATLAASFRTVEETGGNGSYKLLLAHHPRRGAEKAGHPGRVTRNKGAGNRGTGR
ncbi:MAG: class I SAM-dependent methyltransferase [Pararhodobacter sp.]|nr:class I SAM-dependent methyltransferase [Pararhodobacter sp.]